MPTSRLTIMFRGLMILRQHSAVTGESRFEVGLLDARRHHHYPRIRTIKNSVLYATTDLDTFITEYPDSPPQWRLEIDGPVGGVTRHEVGMFNRLTHGEARDFRWIVNLEEDKFHGPDFSKKLATARLNPIIHIPSGQFYTRLKSPELDRIQAKHRRESFGCLAAVTGCDITLEGSQARLMAQGSAVPIFTFGVEENTIYEITNTPPDFVPGQHPMASTHFRHYYKLLKIQNDPDVTQFDFVLANSSHDSFNDRAPDPSLCGVTFLGEKRTPLGQDTDS